jgi:ArsR family transcriptional regulator, arsenate/arsenite/antimonite-responsive transcriptional repressor / arsenate reductase (thioredoxin)
MDIAEIIGDPNRRIVLAALRDNDLTAGDIARLLEVPAPVASYQIREMVRTGLVVGTRSEKDARRIYYRLDERVLYQYLHELHTQFFSQPRIEDTSASILFVCRANSARSQMAAAWARALLPPSMSIASAGMLVRPVHRLTVAVMHEVGFDLRDAVVTNVSAVQGNPSLVVSVCDSAQQYCQQRFTQSQLLHWSVPDPARRAHIADFRTARDTLQIRVAALVNRRAGVAYKNP